MYATDAKKRTATYQKRVSGKETELADAKGENAKDIWDTAIDVIEIRSISLSSGEKVMLRLAEATPTTQATDNGRPRTP